MDRDNRRDEPNHKPRYERDRSRSPHRERRDDRRRDRSPFRGNSARGRGGGGRGGGAGAPPHRSDRDNQHHNRDNTPPPPSHRGGGRGSGPNNTRHPYPSGPRSNANHHPSNKPPHRPAAPEVKMELLEGEDEEAFLARIIGFPSFRSTKNTKVPGNERNYAVSKVKKAEYRQYMNRVGGFNRPLSPTRGPA
ncbi:hypothetical protein B0A54_10014 [Friedmanniomyces endolithicus]|uniref:U4/U6.U5 small nuclear ribonucleoprotein 27kDa protein domain-containing protein n=1 Tax=Friedmanniomyces endolithicus TaxID=329885 RepID=A0A4U0UV22_9PEZI|nr:hypothetical protein LTS09_015233 [Friedmanniomyces endolithicus]KAK0306026.1 hypothetical protein LTR01_006374 [Friedmanniomyces endolithicus]KAK0828261.1 hypothetical protein LTR73_005214 [Friedmanniomyces endolithicus]TKA38965.1 hypothetical protein B0A54_10014 [Friedmanniomyces endolithicus]